MNKPLILALLATFAAIPLTAVPHRATAAEANTAPVAEESRTIQTLTERYELCILNEDCSTNDRLDLLEKMNLKMQSLTAQISQKCIEMHYHGCIDVQATKIRNIALLNRNISDIIATLDPAKGYIPRSPQTRNDPHILNQYSPAAGATPKKNWWSEIFSARRYNSHQAAD